MSICSKNVILKTVNQSPHNLGKISPKKRLYLRNHFYSPQSFGQLPTSVIISLKTAQFQYFIGKMILPTTFRNSSTCFGPMLQMADKRLRES